MARLSKQYEILVYTAATAANLPRYTPAEKLARQESAAASETTGGKRESKRIARRMCAAEGKGARAEVFAGDNLLNLYAQFETLERPRSGALYAKELEV